MIYSKYSVPTIEGRYCNRHKQINTTQKKLSIIALRFHCWVQDERGLGLYWALALWTLRIHETSERKLRGHQLHWPSIPTTSKRPGAMQKHHCINTSQSKPQNYKRLEAGWPSSFANPKIHISGTKGQFTGRLQSAKLQAGIIRAGGPEDSEIDVDHQCQTYCTQP